MTTDRSEFVLFWIHVSSDGGNAVGKRHVLQLLNRLLFFHHIFIDDSQVQRPPRADVRPRPRRFYAKIELDPNRPTSQVSNIAQSILSELDRVRGTNVTLTLDINAETTDGFPEDVESVVRDNAADLRITDFGFEGE